MGLRFQGSQWLGMELPVPRGAPVSAFCLLRRPLGGTVLSFRSLHEGYHRLYVGRSPTGGLYVRAATCVGLGTLKEHIGFITMGMGDHPAEEWVPVSVEWCRDGVRMSMAGRVAGARGVGTNFSLERVSVGRLDGFIPRDYLRADVAHLGVWAGHKLSRGEVQALRDGYEPRVVCSKGLVSTAMRPGPDDKAPLAFDGPPFREVTSLGVEPPKPRPPAPTAAKRPR